MVCVISRGVKVAPGPHSRGLQLNDAVAKNRYNLRYVKHGYGSYSVYQGEIKAGKSLGNVIGFPGKGIWFFSPSRDGFGQKVYMAPTRFEAINAFYHFYREFDFD